MNILHKSLAALILFSILAHHSHAELKPATTLNELLTRVIEGRNADSEKNQARLKAFTEAKEQQAKLLRNAKQENQRLENTGNQLNQKIDENDRLIGELETQLAKDLGNFGELFGVTRQVANDTRSQISNSIISAQFPGRSAELEKIAAEKELPTVDQLRKLWVVLLQEQMEQGNVTRFTTHIRNTQGHHEEAEVVRVGAFSAVADGKFLSLNQETEELTYLPKQPASQYTHSAKNLVNASADKLVNMTIDPSRGAILGLLIQTPSLLDRFKQGGLPGYVVSGLAIVGLLIGLFRFFELLIVGIRVKRQIKSSKIELNNPLGRVLHTYEENPSADIETLELKLDDAVLKEVPKLDRGLNTLKVLAAVAPLIGLLGTVVGMILTFQAITLWGTGEPKIMAGGISQALVTTVQGLVAAIPLLLIHSLANGRARIIQQILEEQSAGLIARRAERSHA